MKKLLIFCFGILLSAGLQAQDLYIQTGKLVDTKSGKVLTEKTIIVSEERIKSVENGFVNPKSEKDSVIDLRDKTVLPGLTDMHVHLESETNPQKYMERFINDPVDAAFNSVGFAKTTLMAGFTTVRELGGSGVNIALRDAIDQGKIPGPRIITAGKSLATTGGHADPTNGMNSELTGNPGPKEGVVNGPEDAAKAVRQRYKNGADLIKITATGGVLSVAKSSSNPQFTEEEIRAIVKTANDYDFHVAAHAHGDEGMQRAIRAGVKTIEHGTKMSEETMDLMKEYDAYLVPTITAGKEVTQNAEIENYYPALVVPKAREIGPQIQGMFERAYKRGVGIAFGTDAGVFKHGENAREFVYMTEAGMPAMEAIQSATITAAKILKKENEIGQIAEGFYADIIAVDEDPTENIETLKDVKFVMKEGKIYKK
ncbi:metal-dependent hydrolase family protein [Salegentibacter mishustinae]|uniref:Amidohydrolase n=1 Tax=Salegentibacter mishustinae TaxID=270918 RepID=A0A0Q9ZN58_9FLAO|nr:amidohydrolase family protein [Salegentibacter mishustinae]KRG30750.1 amidohydrolase [Salegentibacter mishustinae]PNW23639.1 amidohydrolase [Salegentibacter mishustinae]PZX66725.1 imidazolonepropionase-like amidohydrolase [Salegentibacter mishustinae]GGW84178.1 Xaa-Pro dipeptidase [Salegentibacter mishustinae]